MTLSTLGKKLWLTLSSIKTGVVLLIIVVILAAVGTIILQRPVTEPNEMQRAYSAHALRIFDALGLTDVFHACTRVRRRSGANPCTWKRLE